MAAVAQAFDDVPGISSWRQKRNCQCGYDQTVGIDPEDPTRVYLGFQDLWRSTDSGATWTDVTSNLPRIPVNAIVM